MSKVKFLGKNGRPGQAEDACMILTPGESYEVVGGIVYSSVSYYELEGIEGMFNTVMFSGTWEDHTDVLNLEFPGAHSYE